MLQNLGLITFLHLVFLTGSYLLLSSNVRNLRLKFFLGFVGTTFFLLGIRWEKVTLNQQLNVVSLMTIVDQTNVTFSYGLFLLILVVSITKILVMDYLEGKPVWNLLYLSMFIYWFFLLNILLGLIPSVLWFLEFDLWTYLYSTQVLPVDNEIKTNDFIRLFMDRSGSNPPPGINPAEELKGEPFSRRRISDTETVVCLDVKRAFEAEAARSPAPKPLKDLYFKVTKALLAKKDLECRVVKDPETVQQDYPPGYPPKK